MSRSYPGRLLKVPDHQVREHILDEHNWTQRELVEFIERQSERLNRRVAFEEVHRMEHELQQWDHTHASGN